MKKNSIYSYNTNNTMMCYSQLVPTSTIHQNMSTSISSGKKPNFGNLYTPIYILGGYSNEKSVVIQQLRQKALFPVETTKFEVFRA